MITAQLINHRKRSSQHGQAMVEYAIILIIGFLFLFGAVELSSAGFSSYKTTDAAKSGINDFVYANATNLNATSDEIQVIVDNIEDLENELNTLEPDGSDRDHNLIEDNQENFLTMVAQELVGIDVNNDGFIDRDDLNIQLINDLLVSADNIDYDNYPNSGPPRLVSPRSIIDPGDGEIYNKKIELLEQQRTRLAFLSIPLSLADHDPVTNLGMSRPQCVGDSYDDGLPNRYVDPVRYEAYYEDGDDQIYLFNPLPVDSESCVGFDDERGNQSRLSILIGGYFDKNQPELNVPGLPKLNQAMFSLNTRVCLEGNDYSLDRSCENGEWVMKPPGKLCLSDDPDAEGCPDRDNDAARPVSGYYFFGNNENSTTAEPEFRPTFQIECNNAGFASTGNMTESCYDGMGNVIATENLRNLRVHTRYRYVFDSFVSFGNAQLDNLDNLAYYYNPGRMNKSGPENVFGAPGSELGPLANNGLPTVKPFKDFRGCYEVDLSTNQVSACN
ncbi:TadE/TadG family type IV pilus assembly protein [Methylobacillus flagellatus]|uniref:TadE/TadG family type IV pilus assembly protein n=1 Tax=Methylobacillus flagellatus TaxID=405 RepID=UPI0010F5B3B7|nr:TadE family protein [Methylobacillus flagellatus]